jgi:hypothetical protein
MASTHLFPCCSTSTAKQNDKKKQIGLLIRDRATGRFFQNNGEFFKKSRFFVNSKNRDFY